MTEKRFNFNIMFGEDEYTGTVFENGKILKTTDVVYLLNKLSKENEWLKKSIKRQQSSNEECSKYIEEVVKENEQLKERISELKFLLELAKLHTEVAEGKMDKFVELKFE